MLPPTHHPPQAPTQKFKPPATLYFLGVVGTSSDISRIISKILREGVSRETGWSLKALEKLASEIDRHPENVGLAEIFELGKLWGEISPILLYDEWEQGEKAIRQILDKVLLKHEDAKPRRKN